jgi:hypothetical protein
MATKLNQEQILKNVYDELNNALKIVMATISTQIELSAGDGDSVRVYQGVEPLVPFDYIGYVHPDNETVVETYRSGGASGTIVGVVTKVYTDNSHSRLVSQTRS